MAWSHLFAQITIVLAPFALGILIYGIKTGAAYLTAQVAHLHNQGLQHSLDWAIGTAKALLLDLVVSANQTTVNTLKAEGHWDATAAASIKQQVLDKLMVQLEPEAKAILTANLPNLASWAQETLESLVSTAPNKATKPAS